MPDMKAIHMHIIIIITTSRLQPTTQLNFLLFMNVVVVVVTAAVPWVLVTIGANICEKYDYIMCCNTTPRVNAQLYTFWIRQDKNIAPLTQHMLPQSYVTWFKLWFNWVLFHFIVLHIMMSK